MRESIHAPHSEQAKRAWPCSSITFDALWHVPVRSLFVQMYEFSTPALVASGMRFANASS
jgi:hypothetical protein